MILSGIRNQDWQVQVLVEYLLYAAVIHVLPAIFRHLVRIIVAVILIAQVALMRNIVRWVISERLTRRGARLVVEKRLAALVSKDVDPKPRRATTGISGEILTR